MFWRSVIFSICIYNALGADLKIDVQFKPDECYESAENGDEVHVHYTGMLKNGQVFDSSVQQGRPPLPFVLGTGKVIQGWEQGILGMCVGERRKLTIPSDLAYGDRGMPPTIPAKATLVFETELVQLNKPPAAPLTDHIVPAVQVLAVPLAILCICYYLYKKYQEDDAALKEEKRGKKRK